MKHKSGKVLALLLAVTLLAGMFVMPASAAPDTQIGTKLADKLFAENTNGTPKLDTHAMGMMVKTIKLFMDVDDALGMCNTLNTALLSMYGTGQAGQFIDNGVSFYIAYAISQYILDNEGDLTYGKLESYTGVNGDARDKAAFAAAINARAEDFWEELQKAGDYDVASFENGLAKMDRVFSLLYRMTVVYPEMFFGEDFAQSGATFNYDEDGTLSLDRERTEQLLGVASGEFPGINSSPDSPVYEAIEELATYYNNSSSSGANSDKELLFIYLKTYRFINFVASGTTTPGTPTTPGGGGTGGGAIAPPQDTEIIDDDELALGTPAFPVATTITNGRANSIFRMADWEAIRDEVNPSNVMLDGQTTQKVNLATFGIEYNVLLAMQKENIFYLSLMTDGGRTAFTPDTFTTLMNNRLSEVKEDVADTAVLYFDMDRLTRLQAFPDGLSDAQRLAYRVGSLIFRSSLRTSLTVDGQETESAVPEATRFDKPLVLSWNYEPNANISPDTLTAWLLAEDGQAYNVGGRYNEFAGLFQTLVRQMGHHTVSRTIYSFLDMPEGWARNALGRLSAMAVLTGHNNQIRPASSVTRAEFARMLSLTLKLVAADSEEDRFPDVKASDWFRSDVAAAVAAGIIRGNGNGTFAPGQNITRQDMAVMIVRALADAAPEADTAWLDGYEDGNDISDYARDAVAVITETGIMTGKPGDLFDPYGHATRAEAAAVVYRMLDYLLTR